jgi:hypothetical protein
MKHLPVQSTVDIACEIQDRLRANCEDASITQSMLAYINDKAEFRELFRNTQAANGLNAIYSALLHNVVLALSRIFDNPKGKDRASIPRLMEMLGDGATRTQLMDTAAAWVGGRFAEKIGPCVVTELSAPNRSSRRLWPALWAAMGCTG